MFRFVSRRALVMMCLATALAAGESLAQTSPSFIVGKIRIEQPWSRATPRSAPVAGGYLKITNTGEEPDRLVSGESLISRKFSVHEMAMDGGVMKMRPLAAGLEIKPGASVELKPGGFHLMFEELKGGLTEGQKFKATLVFEKAGKVEVEFAVMSMGANAPGMQMDHGAHHH
jgi:copper(I)-binding protein